MGAFSKKKVQMDSARPSDASVLEAVKKGNAVTKCSLFVFGLGNLLNRQFVRGGVFLATEIAYLYYMVSFGIQSIVNFTTLGTREQGQVPWAYTNTPQGTIPCCFCSTA